MFIVFEGGDGCGKSTQLELCRDWLKSNGIQCVSCSDPGTTELGKRVRRILLEHDDFEIGNRAESLLFMVARAQLIEEVVAPALAQNQIVLCDRFVLSTVVYQGYAGELSPDEIYSIGKIATNDTMPDLTLVFDLPVEIAQERLGPEKDRMESRGIDYFERVRSGFREEAEKHSNIKLIDASRSAEEIHGEVKKIVRELLDGSSYELD